MAATLRQLEYLVTVVDTGSFTRAAEQLHVTQPALSHQVRALESALGGPLLERLPRAVRPTPLGRAVLPHARAVLADAQRLHAAARRTAGLEDGELEVATVHSIALGILPPVLRAWRRRYPAVRIRLREYPHADLLRAAMAAGGADLAVGPVPTDWDGPVRELGVEEFALVLPSDDPLANPPDGALPLSALADRAWVHYAPGHGLAELLDQSCARAGFLPHPAVRTEQTAAAPCSPPPASARPRPRHHPPPPSTPPSSTPPPIHRPLAAYTRTRPDHLTTTFTEILATHTRLTG
ncbi:LysR family transcriptional regulator [Kitasatospora griseola]|uniref:LysR family transcriptional regulator n=1 Tax=Kitasatospora griseola TaxID=2064 RepID=UPI000AFCAA3B|nr:LysR family transcriptional regulator [Kitasatospora griseola]